MSTVAGPALRWRPAGGHRLLPALCSLVALAAPGSTQQAADLTPAEQDSASRYLSEALAGPRQSAYQLVLVEAVLARDPADTAAVYDLVVGYDPGRYHSPYAGLYPLSFEDQFIQWGKRIALFTRSTRWSSGRFYLHDISTGQQGWIYADEARRLYPPQPTQFPPPAAIDDPVGQAAWLKLIGQVQPATDLRTMGTWLRLMRRESREAVQARAPRVLPPDTAATGG